jgi:hypothetical protein
MQSDFIAGTFGAMTLQALSRTTMANVSSRAAPDVSKIVAPTPA